MSSNSGDARISEASSAAVQCRIESPSDVDVPLRFDEERVMMIMTENIYHSFLAVVRELVRNGIDSIRERRPEFGENDYIRIRIDAEECVVSVEDTGIGLSHRDVVEVYSVLGRTSKSPNSSLGIGSKSPFLVTDVYLVQSWAEPADPVNFTVARKGIKFLDKSTMSSLTHCGTKVWVPFNPSKLKIDELAGQVKELVKYIPIPVFLVYAGEEQMLSTHQLAEFVTKRVTEKDREDVTIHSWENKRWSACLAVGRRDHYRRWDHDGPFRVFVDWMPVDSTRIEHGRFPLSEYVAVNFTDRSMVDLAADRDTLVDNDRTDQGFQEVQRETEERVVSAMLGAPFDPLDTLLWDPNCDKLSILRVVMDNLDYLRRVTGWSDAQIEWVKSLFHCVTVIIGSGKPTRFEGTNREQVMNLLKAIKLKGFALYYRDQEKCNRVLPVSSVCLFPRVPIRLQPNGDERDRGDTLDSQSDILGIIREFGGKPLSELPIPSYDMRSVVKHWVRYANDYRRFIGCRQTVMLREVTDALVIPSGGVLKLVFEAERIYQNRDGDYKGTEMFVARPKANRACEILEKQKGVKSFQQFLAKAAKTKVKYYGKTALLGDICARWRQMKGRRKLLFVLPREAEAFTSPEIHVTRSWTPLTGRLKQHTNLVTLLFVEDNRRLPDALKYVVTQTNLFNPTDIVPLAHQVIKGMLRSKKASELFRRHCKATYSSGYGRHAYICDERQIWMKNNKHRKSYAVNISEELHADIPLLCRLVRILLHRKRAVGSVARSVLGAVEWNWFSGVLDFMKKVDTVAKSLEQLENSIRSS